MSSVGRTRDKSGRSSYASDGLNLASFKESSELEFGADDAFILSPLGVDGEVVLRHLKARHSEPRDIALRFNGSCQQFLPVEPPSEDTLNLPPTGSAAELAALWSGTEAAHNGEGSS